MSVIDVGCTLRYRVLAPTSFLFNIAAAATRFQTLNFERCSAGSLGTLEFGSLGVEGNRILRLQLNPGELVLDYRAQVVLKPQLRDATNVAEIAFPDLPIEVLPYLNPSRYCEADRLSRLALREFGTLVPGHQRVQAISNWVATALQYISGSTDVRSSACDVLVQGAGVCRDYAHLAISLCRAICIPARYVSGYAVGLEPPDFHGFFEAYLEGGWYLFDATAKASSHGLVRIGTGRDAADVSFATIIGNAELCDMQVRALDRTGAVPEEQPNQAVSTA